MAVSRTFSIIKPDATRRNLTGAITKMLEDAGLRVVASKRLRMTRDQAEGFYAVHRERPFYNDLCTFMTSGPVVVQVLEGENAVLRNGELMGATNHANADEGTIKRGLLIGVKDVTILGDAFAVPVADHGGDVTQPHARVVGDAQQGPCMVGEKAPTSHAHTLS